MSLNTDYTAMTVKAPCDLYGMNARKLNRAINEVGEVLEIKKPDENLACRASSLIGLLSLGVRKGETIQFVTRSESGHWQKHLQEALDSIAS